MNVLDMITCLFDLNMPMFCLGYYAFLLAAMSMFYLDYDMMRYMILCVIDVC